MEMSGGGTDGPYTRIHDVKNNIYNNICAGSIINDIGINYNKIYFIDKGNTLIDYSTTAGTLCTSEGFPTSLLRFKFNSTYFYFTPLLDIELGTAAPILGIPRGDIYETIDVTSGSRLCDLCDNIQLTDVCFSQFKMHVPAQGLRLNLITDRETYENSCADDKYIYDFYIYVGNCHSDCLTCLGVTECLSCYAPPQPSKLCPLVDGGDIGSCVSACTLCTIIGENTYEKAGEDKCYSNIIYIYIYIRM